MSSVPYTALEAHLESTSISTCFLELSSLEPDHNHPIRARLQGEHPNASLFQSVPAEQSSVMLFIHLFIVPESRLACSTCTRNCCKGYGHARASLITRTAFTGLITARSLLSYQSEY
jgi:hypothetical protein